MVGRGRRRAWREVLVGLSGVWTGWWALVGGLGLAREGVTGESLVLAAFFGVLAGAPVPWLVRTVRERRAERRHAALAGSVAAVEAARERLPEDVRARWVRLQDAWRLVSELAGEGVVEPSALLEARRSIERLEDLLVADARTEGVGGQRSEPLRRQLAELVDLLVALADEAVDHQATLAGDWRAPATLVEARERLAAQRQAYRELEG